MRIPTGMKPALLLNKEDGSPRGTRHGWLTIKKGTSTPGTPAPDEVHLLTTNGHALLIVRMDTNGDEDLVPIPQPGQVPREALEAAAKSKAPFEGILKQTGEKHDVYQVPGVPGMPTFQVPDSDNDEPLDYNKVLPDHTSGDVHRLALNPFLLVKLAKAMGMTEKSYQPRVVLSWKLTETGLPHNIVMVKPGNLNHSIKAAAIMPCQLPGE